MKFYFKLISSLFFAIFMAAATCGIVLSVPEETIDFRTLIALVVIVGLFGLAVYFYGYMALMTILRKPAIEIDEEKLKIRSPLKRNRTISLETICGDPAQAGISIGSQMLISYKPELPEKKKKIKKVKNKIKKVKIPIGLISYKSESDLEEFLAKLYPPTSPSSPNSLPSQP